MTTPARGGTTGPPRGCQWPPCFDRVVAGVEGAAVVVDPVPVVPLPVVPLPVVPVPGDPLPMSIDPSLDDPLLDDAVLEGEAPADVGDDDGTNGGLAWKLLRLIVIGSGS